MKKQTKQVLLLVTAILLIFSTAACTRTKTQNKLEKNTVESPTYYYGEPNTETPSDSPSEQATDNPTEAPTTLPTEPPTDQPTEAPTEAPTEPEPSLEYRSFGNGTCSVVGIGEIEDLYVVIPERSPEGDIVTTVEDGAFFGNSKITVVQIPSTVYSIGKLAFADCKSLVHIAVHENNTHFVDIDGVLFDKAMTNLMCYPAAKASSSLMLPETVSTISDMALYGCDSLKLIQFEGSVEMWASVTIGEKNYGLYTASLAFAKTEA